MKKTDKRKLVSASPKYLFFTGSFLVKLKVTSGPKRGSGEMTAEDDDLCYCLKLSVGTTCSTPDKMKVLQLSSLT